LTTPFGLMYIETIESIILMVMFMGVFDCLKMREESV